MEQLVKNAIKASVQNFNLPTYEEIPDVGLYLEQTTSYVAEHLAPLQNISITTSMVSNYVKQGLIDNPVKKLYYRDQIAYLFFIAVAKNVLSMENLSLFIGLQKESYSVKKAYDYFCEEMENILYFRFGLKDSVTDVGVTSSLEKEMLRSAITAVSHIVYLNRCFRLLADSSIP